MSAARTGRGTARTPARIARAMSERELDEAVRAIAKDLGLFRFHAYDSRRSGGPGFPDLVIAGLGGVLFRELKTEREKPARAQQAWLDILAAAGADAGVWRPSSLLSGQIAQELAAIAGLVSAEVTSAGT